MLGFLWIIQKDIQSPQPAVRSPQPAARSCSKRQNHCTTITDILKLVNSHDPIDVSNNVSRQDFI
jgi:hypothetical protein